jgi:predicted MFS family arabinose efflux permease
MNFWIYLTGIAIVIGGVAWGLMLAHVSPTYVMVACTIMLGAGVLTAVTRTRQKDPPA